ASDTIANDVASGVVAGGRVRIRARPRDRRRARRTRRRQRRPRRDARRDTRQQLRRAAAAADHVSAGLRRDAATKTISVHYPNAQLFPSLNVVFVCWINGNTVSNVSDGTGNTYTRAVGPSTNNGMNLSVYYA